MIRLSVKTFCVALFALLLTGCNVTFQSSQFTFVKNLFAQEQPLPEKNWQVRWQEKTYSVFAVNHDKGTFFADERGFLVAFDGWQIRQVSIAQSTDGIVAVIEKSKEKDGVISLDYKDGDSRRLTRDKCQAWERTTGRGWEQNCTSAENPDDLDAGYINTIEMNTNGELVALRFMVLPGTDPMQIRLQQ